MTIDSQITESLKLYQQAWSELSAKHSLPHFSATTLSVKVADKTALYHMLETNAANIEQVHIGTVNDRYIASAALDEPFEGLVILKILERRAGSNDPLGLDSLDYLIDDIEATYQLLTKASLAVVKEHNDVHAWLSLRFGDTNQFEAKFTDHLVLAVAIKEMQMTVDGLLKTLA